MTKRWRACALGAPSVDAPPHSEHQPNKERLAFRLTRDMHEKAVRSAIPPHDSFSTLK
ncbi:hypothetical protein GSH05_22455 [Burkholderia pseudomallei]|uniref:Uncharacterized protein n=4 Tax=pseudomallei group TaxID=111527 RepID=A0AAX1XF24_BURML|nr:hypothetical protein BMAA0178 [Burkholderia mallei ATCC 23344]AUG25140.1 hypothetical protein CXQ84_33290 [Burkholderia pseudomallei]EEP52177.1 conserved hypothetical protein [Burkholderia pseudomallei MSHR346]EET03100.1 conserved hypothetical protein [Burkholderia pseudomallei 1710a]RKN93446.1 hypothetical protein D8O31_24780 [Burkholderia mallei]